MNKNKMKKILDRTSHSRKSSQQKSKGKKRSQDRISHLRKPSFDCQLGSKARLTMHVSPRHARKFTNYLKSNPTSLEKKKTKGTKKKTILNKKFKQEITRETLDSLPQQNWRQALRLTFRQSSTKLQKYIFNDSLRCIKQLGDFQLKNESESFRNLIDSFPKHGLSKTSWGTKERIYLVDWLNYVSTQFHLQRNTFHLAVSYLDQYQSLRKSEDQTRLQVIGAAALLLAIKQEERGGETQLIQLLSQKQLGQKKECIIKCQSQIVLALNFKLNHSTLPFWSDYFSQKWDKFVQRNSISIQNMQIPISQHLISIRKSLSINYRYYREISQFLDAVIIHQDHKNFEFSRLSLAILYLVIRINSQALMMRKDSADLYNQYSLGFKQKSSPIFRDLSCFNAMFNDFLSETCSFQLDEIIPMVRWCSKFLSMGFTYEIDIISYQTSVNYESFLRLSTYSEHIRNFHLSLIQ